MGDPGGGQLTAKMGNDKVNGARGADDKQKTKTEGAGEKNVPGKNCDHHRPEPSREGPLSKMTLSSRRGCYFCKIEERKKRPQNSIYSRNGAAKGAPGGSLGGPWVPLGGPLGDPWGSLKRLPGAQGDPWTPISANRRPSKIIGFIV